MDGSLENDPAQRRIAASVRFYLGDVPIVDDQGRPILPDVSPDQTQPEQTQDLVA